jgi:hypothetical protein
MEYAEGHVTKIKFNAIFSQSALADRLKYPLAESAVVRGALTGPKLKKNRKATALQILDSQSPEVAKRKPHVLLSDKPSSGVEVEKLPEFLQEGILEPITESTPQLLQKSRSEPPRFLKKKFSNFSSTLLPKSLLPNRLIVLDKQGKKKEKTRWGTMCLQFWR